MHFMPSQLHPKTPCMPEQTSKTGKKTILTQEMLRLRCSPERKWKETAIHGNELTKQCQYLGTAKCSEPSLQKSAHRDTKKEQRRHRTHVQKERKEQRS